MQLDFDEAIHLGTFLTGVRRLPDFSHLDSVVATTIGCFGNTPLHVAAIRGDAESVSLLIRAGANVNAHGEMGFTPLHEAVLHGHCNVASRLLGLGASTSSVNDDGDRPIDLALLANDERTGNELVTLLAMTRP